MLIKQTFTEPIDFQILIFFNKTKSGTRERKNRSGTKYSCNQYKQTPPISAKRKPQFSNESSSHEKIVGGITINSACFIRSLQNIIKLIRKLTQFSKIIDICAQNNKFMIMKITWIHMIQ